MPLCQQCQTGTRHKQNDARLCYCTATPLTTPYYTLKPSSSLASVITAFSRIHSIGFARMGGDEARRRRLTRPVDGRCRGYLLWAV
jgi:hypothetical protein